VLEKETESIFVIAVTYFLDSKLSDIPEAYRPKKGPLQAISVELILEDLANQLRARMTETEAPEAASRRGGKWGRPRGSRGPSITDSGYGLCGTRSYLGVKQSYLYPK
jgi:hypothetical protein